MEALELRDHEYYVAVQYHPEYLSRPLGPSPPYVGLLLAASNQLETDLGRNLRSLAVRSRNSSINVENQLSVNVMTPLVNGIGEDVGLEGNVLRNALNVVKVENNLSD
jgi:hypothetical protein